MSILALVVLSVARGLIAQESAPIRNLGASWARLQGNWLAYSVWETFSGEDLNGDGDDLDYWVVHVHDFSSGKTTNLGLAGEVYLEPDYQVSGNWLVFAVSEGDPGGQGEGEDLNGNGEVRFLEEVYHIADLSAIERLPQFLRGDVTGDGSVQLSDVLFFLSVYLFGPAERLVCPDAADADDDGRHSIADAVFLVSRLFAEPALRPNPKAPFPRCGFDPTPDRLDEAATGGRCLYPAVSCP